MSGLHGMRGGTDGFVKNNGLWLEFYHLPTKNIVRFKAFITDYSEAYNVNFNEQDVYGRMDPIATYQGTKRKINLAWTVVAESVDEAYENWKKVQQYIKMMYPSYKKFIFDAKDANKFSATTLSAPPLLKMKFMNLIADSSAIKIEEDKVVSNKSAQGGGIIKQRFVKYTSGDVKDGGLLVVPGSLQINPNWHDRSGLMVQGKKLDPHAGTPTNRPLEYEDYVSSGSPFVVPIEINMSSEFTVLHQHDLGTVKTVNKGKAQRGAALGKQIAKDEKKLANAAKKAAKTSSLDKLLAGKNTGSRQVIDNARSKLKKKKAKKDKLLKNLVSGVKDKEGFGNFPYGIIK